MNTRSRGRLVIPAALAVTVIACTTQPAHHTTDGGAGGSGTGGGGTGGVCEPVRVVDAGVLTYECEDGRTCSAPNPDAIDGGVYQVCPGNGDCATLVSYDGGAMLGYC
jgi:hypothetical protein